MTDHGSDERLRRDWADATERARREPVDHRSTRPHSPWRRPRRPPAALPDPVAATLAALARDTTPTVRSLASASGYSLESTHAALHRLRDAGMVGFVDGKRGTLHPTFAVVVGEWTAGRDR